MSESGADAFVPEAIVAGHICVDVIPALPDDPDVISYRPGVLTEIGPAAVATGGCVSNTGQALHRLGVRTELVGKIGDDAFAQVVRGVLARTDLALAQGMLVTPGEHTSYSLILNPPGGDRMFLHFPGANDTFVSEDIPDRVFARGRLFHFGYPPLMRRMYEDGGVNLARLLRRAKEAGLTTSLDMAYPDPARPAGQADWQAILARVLPYVDVFVPSLDELAIMLEGLEARQALACAGPDRAQRAGQFASRSSARLLEMGAAIVGIKAGDLGFYVRTGDTARLRGGGRGLPPNTAIWAGRELWSSVFEVRVVGTVGAGDATVAGFLYGLLRAMTPEEAITAACAVGAASVEAPDATSGILDWPATQARLEAGWRRRPLDLGPLWHPLARKGLWTTAQPLA
jgi:sugar/nucleoside kinase (ribokinase family)